MSDIIARAEAALEGVTEGPWDVIPGANGNVWHFPEEDERDQRPHLVVRMGGMKQPDAAFIAAARTLVPELIAALKSTRAELERTTNLLRCAREGCGGDCAAS